MTHVLDLSLAVWRTSSYSDGGDSNCVEVAGGYPAVIPVRDSKIPDGPVIVFGASSWMGFLNALEVPRR